MGRTKHKGKLEIIPIRPLHGKSPIIIQIINTNLNHQKSNPTSPIQHARPKGREIPNNKAKAPKFQT
jgi:hypothetical protein